MYSRYRSEQTCNCSRMKATDRSPPIKSSSLWIYITILSCCLFSCACGFTDSGRGGDTAIDKPSSIGMYGGKNDINRVHSGHEHYRNRLRRRKLDTVIDPDERLTPEQRKQKRVIKAALRINGTLPDPALLQQLSAPQLPAKEVQKEKPKAPVNFLQANEQLEEQDKPSEPPGVAKPVPMKSKPAPQSIKPAPQSAPVIGATQSSSSDAANAGEQQPLQSGFRKTAIPNQQATLVTPSSEVGASVVSGLQSSTVGPNKMSQVEKKDKQDVDKQTEKEESKQQLNHAFANVLSVLEFGKSKESKSYKASSNILSKPDLIPGVLRSIPVSNALAIHPVVPPTPDGVKGGALSIDVKTGYVIFKILYTRHHQYFFLSFFSSLFFFPPHCVRTLYIAFHLCSTFRIFSTIMI